MLKKLISPRAKGARGGESSASSGGAQPTTSDTALSALTGAPDDSNSSSSSSAIAKDDGDGSTAPRQRSTRLSRVGRAAASALSPRAKAKQTKAPLASDDSTASITSQRDDMRLDMHAVAEAAAADKAADAIEAGADVDADVPPTRRKTVIRSPRVRKNLVRGTDDDTKDAPVDSKDVPSAHVADSSASNEPARTKAPSKRKSFAGLRSLKPRSGGAKSSQDTVATAAVGQAVSSSGSTTLIDTATTATKAPSKTPQDDDSIDECDTADNNDDSETEQSPPALSSSVDPPLKNVLSPLRRLAPRVVSTAESTMSAPALAQRLQLRALPPASQPEVHIVGEITGSAGDRNSFGSSSSSGGFVCKWSVEVGDAWTHIAGDQVGQTQVDYPTDARVVWSHPLELHYATTSLHGWPRLLLQVWRVDTHMRASVAGYGFVNVPFASGEHCVTASLWRPKGSAVDELAATLLGRTPELVSDDVVLRAAYADRCRLQTIASGLVELQLAIVRRNFDAASLAT